MNKHFRAILGLFLIGQAVLGGTTVLLTDNFQTTSFDASTWTIIKATGHDSFDETTAGNASLSLQLEKSDDLVTWTNAGDAVNWSIPVDQDKQFIRVRSAK